MLTSINPATGDTIATHAALTDAEIEEHLARAQATFTQWRVTDYATRTALLGRIADAFEADKHALAEIATREMGKTLKSAIRSEEHTSELQSLIRISYAVFCLKKKT